MIAARAVFKFIEASSIVPAARMRPGFGNPSPGGPGDSTPAKRRGGRRATRRGSPMLRAILLGPRGALRRAVRRFLRRRAALFGSPLRSASGLRLRPLSGGRARKPRANLGGPPSASSSRRVFVPAGGAPAPPGSVACWPRPRAPARSPRAGATGSRPSRGSGVEEYDPRLWRNYVLEIICHGRACPGHPRLSLGDAQEDISVVGHSGI